ncbi:sigma 54-interacting transcriptional regulator [Alienimonas chondri]|uniref:Anaerobic nitric oxide reductase transcription regulator NorR n=1 Tax=Alienimonas chondri TaxID=2681879 RepID=A0ABX1VB86_9PLAN|nr:sigma 54-interacting transcriptional regulator [Alienimonas chondri]NNJ25038.1 Anaerobic nitric oxide reductase transcription regulator NorR [Alienimonas chondri]
MSAAPRTQPAYLATRGGSGWRDLYRLDPAVSTTIGRAMDCRVTLSDERASRSHAELFVPTSGEHAGEWHVRDLNSRNGTTLNGDPVPPETPQALAEGDELSVGESRLIFTHDPAAPLPDGDDGLEGETRGGVLPKEGGAGTPEEPKILDRRRDTRLSGRSPDGPAAGDRRAATLYRLALALGSAADATAAGEAALDVLLDRTPADIAAVLLLAGDQASGESTSKAADEDPDAHRRAARTVRHLSLVAHRARTDGPYRLVSESLSRAVLAGGEAVLAEDVDDDDRLAGRDSLGQLRAESLICAPLRPLAERPGGEGIEEGAERIIGLVHLYSLDPGNPLDSSDLDFTLAVADQLALALANLRDRDDLAHDREELAKQTESLAAGLSKAEQVNATLRRSLFDGDALGGEMIGESGPTIALREELRRIAPTDATVLVRGESGVGKELVARALHRHGSRSAGPLVTMNCAALSESLLESELFGHEKGAFTGATAKTVGKFEAADGGTLFLDEVGEMSPAIQAKFLRVLEGHAFERVGGREQIRCDVRVVAATNRDLEAAVEKGAFRRDLYYRLHVVVLTVEPLRNRPEDVPVLAEHFLRVSAARAGREIEGFTPAAEQLLMEYRWPGNVRELKNAVERAVVLCRGSHVEPADLRLTAFAPPVGQSELDGTSTGADDPSRVGGRYRSISLEVLEREHILATLSHTGWNKSKAASILGIERSTLDRKLKKYGVERPGADV